MLVCFAMHKDDSCVEGEKKSWIALMSLTNVSMAFCEGERINAGCSAHLPPSLSISFTLLPFLSLLFHSLFLLLSLLVVPFPLFLLLSAFLPPSSPSFSLLLNLISLSLSPSIRPPLSLSSPLLSLSLCLLPLSFSSVSFTLSVARRMYK